MIHCTLLLAHMHVQATSTQPVRAGLVPYRLAHFETGSCNLQYDLPLPKKEIELSATGCCNVKPELHDTTGWDSWMNAFKETVAYCVYMYMYTVCWYTDDVSTQVYVYVETCPPA